MLTSHHERPKWDMQATGSDTASNNFTGAPADPASAESEHTLMVLLLRNYSPASKSSATSKNFCFFMMWVVRTNFAKLVL